ncbi:MAG: OmpA family protein, partial [Candidatus Fimadaptatus sp.]
MISRRKRTRQGGEGGGHWICFSDLMSSLVMVFIMVMLFSMYQYYDMFDTKTEELLKQSQLLDSKQAELDSAQAELTAAEKNLALKEALALAQQSTLDELKAQLAAQQSELDLAQSALNSALANLDDQTTKLNALVGVRSQIIAELSDALASANLEANIDEETGDITFSSGIYFDFGSAELKAEGMSSLNEFIPLYFNVLLTDRYRNYLSEVVIEGHADTNGDYMTNLDLSQRRAYAVLSYLLSDGYPYLTSAQKETLRSITTANGRSYSNPVYREDGTVDMDASRRVEFKFRLKDTEMIAEMKKLLENMGQEYITIGGQDAGAAA